MIEEAIPTSQEWSGGCGRIESQVIAIRSTSVSILAHRPIIHGEDTALLLSYAYHTYGARVEGPSGMM